MEEINQEIWLGLNTECAITVQSISVKHYISHLHCLIFLAGWLFLNFIQQGFSLVEPSAYVGNIFIKNL